MNSAACLHDGRDGNDGFAITGQGDLERSLDRRRGGSAVNLQIRGGLRFGSEEEPRNERSAARRAERDRAHSDRTGSLQRRVDLVLGEAPAPFFVRGRGANAVSTRFDGHRCHEWKTREVRAPCRPLTGDLTVGADDRDHR